METPWEVVGFDYFTSTNKNEGCRVFCTRPVQSSSGQGTETRAFTHWIDRNKYEPVVGHKVIALLDRNDRYVDRYIVLA